MSPKSLFSSLRNLSKRDAPSFSILTSCSPLGGRSLVSPGDLSGLSPTTLMPWSRPAVASWRNSWYMACQRSRSACGGGQSVALVPSVDWPASVVSAGRSAFSLVSPSLMAPSAWPARAPELPAPDVPSCWRSQVVVPASPGLGVLGESTWVWSGFAGWSGVGRCWPDA